MFKRLKKLNCGNPKLKKSFQQIFAALVKFSSNFLAQVFPV